MTSSPQGVRSTVTEHKDVVDKWSFVGLNFGEVRIVSAESSVGDLLELQDGGHTERELSAGVHASENAGRTLMYRRVSRGVNNA